MDKKKQRGQKRKLKVIINAMDQLVPFTCTDRVYEHFYVPGGLFRSMFIGSNQTSGRIKTAFSRKWLETTERFIDQKPTDIPFCKQHNIQTTLKECCWHEKMIDEEDGGEIHSDLWFLGDLPTV